MNTPPNSVRTIDPVGHASRHPAFSQCLQTSEEKSQRKGLVPSAGLSTNFTWRHVEWPSEMVLSYDIPVSRKPSAGIWFHSLQATSHALQPMQIVESVRNAVIMISHEPGARPDVGRQRAARIVARDKKQPRAS